LEHGFTGFVGIGALGNSKGANIRHALGWSSVIITSTDQVSGYAMVVAGFQNGSYIWYW
jgi:hypothetical protein